ncbi:MAG: PIN domain-containing protein [Candidatus Lokiarchaeota archaeon]|nr:PIN domain-containing protein [Candidatus Lokiarchaeota archaeon]
MRSIANLIFIDTGVWIGAFVKRDQYHKKAKSIINWVNSQNKYKIIVTNLIMAEVANFLKRKNYGTPARKIVEIFNTDEKIDLYFDDEKMSEITVHLFNQYDRLSYVDANSIAFYWKLKCAYIFSFDSDFDGIRDIKRLENVPD